MKPGGGWTYAGELHPTSQRSALAQDQPRHRRLGSDRKQDSYLRAQFLRIKARRGAKKAILAVAASMLTACYFVLRDDVDYRDLGPHHFDRLDRSETAAA